MVQTLEKEAVHVFLMAPFTIWNPLNHVERKSITSYDETRIVDQRVHVLWQFNVDKPTKTYKNQAATWEDMDHPSNGKPISGAPACSSTTLHSCILPGAIVANQSHSGNRHNSNRRPFEGKEMAFCHQKMANRK